MSERCETDKTPQAKANATDKFNSIARHNQRHCLFDNAATTNQAIFSAIFNSLLEIKSFDTSALYAKPSLTVSEGLDVYAKLGFARLSGDIELTYISPVGCGFAVCTDLNIVTVEYSDTDFIWGVGGEYDMPNGFGLRAVVVGFTVANEPAFNYLLSAHCRFN